MKVFKNQSITLVKLNPQTNQLYITTQAIEYLSQLVNPIAVITIAGLYRTGKSYLVNNLLSNNYGTHLNNQLAFKVGTTTQSMTKGLNILATPISIPCQQTGKNIDYLLIDSEGIGSCEQSAKYDTDLLILIFLISSTVVYNSMGAIDEQGLEQLQVVLKLKNCVENTKHQYQSCQFKYNTQPPKFVWVLRDFALQLIDKHGNQITSDQYLQQCLEQSVNTTNPEVKKKNQIRRAIKDNLGERHCYTLVRPTIKQEDLQHLASIRNQQTTKIRKQFLGQLQCLKQYLFSGRSTDIKKINEQPITGRLFAKILSQYLAVINNNQLPKVNDVWNSVMKVSNQQFFQQLSNQLKKQIKSIKLPFSKQQTKMKLNEIQNRIYKQLQKGITNEHQFKIYHKQFLKLVQKLNKQIKDKNDELRKNNIMSQLHQFVKQNLNYESIKSTNISQFMKQFIQRMRLKINRAQEGYDYLISIINDVFFVVQQKNSKTDREYQEIKKLYDSLLLDKNNLDLTVINLKRQYHESLKTVARLQESQAGIDKNYLLTSTKIMDYQSKIIKLQSELKHTNELHQKQLKNIQQKSKSRIQQLSSQLKKIKQQYEKLNEQNLEKQTKINEQQLVSRKQVIFQQKVQQIYKKFQLQKSQLTKEIESYRRQTRTLNQKYDEMKDAYEQQNQRQKRMQQEYSLKQQNLMKQFDNLKKCIKDTKASYQQTFQTIQSSDQVLKQVNNIAGMSTTRKQKFQTPYKDKQKENLSQKRQQQVNNNLIKKYYESQIQKQNEQHQIQIQKLQKTTDQLQNQIDKQIQQKQMYYMEAKEYKQKCMRLQTDIISVNAQFNEFLKEMQSAKQKERALYQESIVRLLHNIDKKQNRNRDSISNSGISSYSKTYTQSSSMRRGGRISEGHKDSLSFARNSNNYK